jgi:hypothetical protein
VGRLLPFHLQSGSADEAGHAEGDAEEILGESPRNASDPGNVFKRSTSRDANGRGAPSTVEPEQSTRFAEARKPGAPADAYGALVREAKACRLCSRADCATQTVFGEGPMQARAIFVGEQPGGQEDLQGRPFVGPAGELLRSALRDAGFSAVECYLTNAVKHFKFVPRGKRRIHQTPGGSLASGVSRSRDAPRPTHAIEHCKNVFSTF